MARSLIDDLSEEERRSLVASARRRRFRRGEVLFHEGDPGDCVHLVSSGAVAVYVTTPLGSTAVFDVLGSGDAVGELALLSETSERTATAMALEPTETLSLRREQFEALRSQHPSIDRLLIELLAARVRRLSAELMEALFVPAEKRVLRRLGAFAQRVGGERPVIGLTQEGLAGLAGTSRGTVNRVLREAEIAGLVVLHRGRIEVRDVTELVRRGR